MLNIPWSLLLIWFMIRLILEKNTPVGKSECKIFIKKLKTHNLAMDLLKKITKTEIMLFDSRWVGYI